jgi:hypothetical protein
MIDDVTSDPIEKNTVLYVLRVLRSTFLLRTLYVHRVYVGKYHISQCLQPINFCSKVNKGGINDLSSDAKTNQPTNQPEYLNKCQMMSSIPEEMEWM